MELRPKDLAKRAAAYRRMADKAIAPSIKVDFADCAYRADRYEIVAAAVGRAPVKEALEEVD